MNAVDLKGRVAVITGGSRGIGLGVAKRMLSSGAEVVLWDIDEAGLKEATALLGSATADRVDVTDERSVVLASERVVTNFRRLDILINSAGIAGSRAPVSSFLLDDWNRCVTVNLTGTFLCCKYAVPLMQRANYGRIVNLSSMSGKEGTAYAAAYAAAKAGVMALTKSLARELVASEIRVNCITPSAIDTELFRNLPDERRQAALARIPLGRAGRIDEVAGLIAWLASEECSFCTGAAFDMSGGRASF